MADPNAARADLSGRSSPAMMARTSAMMFLQYSPQGIWAVTFTTYIVANTGAEGAGIFSAGFVGYTAAAGAIGSLVSPVVIGFLSDRYFAAQYLLAAMHAGCALAAWGMYQSQTETAFLLSIVLYYQCFCPAAALTNKVGLRNLANSDVEYPWARIFGTLGWISAGLFLGVVWPLVTGELIEATRIPLLLGACGSAAMAVYCLTLPHTPPERRDGGVNAERAGAPFCSEDFAKGGSPQGIYRDAGELLANRPLVAFLAVSMLACVSTIAYNNCGNPFLNHAGYPRPAALMTLGQLSELLCLWATPWLIARFGLPVLFISGVVAWAVRYTLLAVGSYSGLAPPVYAAILLHGPCYVFVYVIGVMYVDRLAGSAHRGAAQGLYALASAGLGHLIGALAVGVAQATLLTPAGVSPPPYHWTAFWIVPAAFSLAAAIMFKVAFSRPQRQIEIEAVAP
jgi:nucleoside transporter